MPKIKINTKPRPNRILISPNTIGKIFHPIMITMANINIINTSFILICFKKWGTEKTYTPFLFQFQYKLFSNQLEFSHSVSFISSCHAIGKCFRTTITDNNELIPIKPMFFNKVIGYSLSSFF